MYNQTTYNTRAYNTQSGASILAIASAITGSSLLVAAILDFANFHAIMQGHSSLIAALGEREALAVAMIGSSHIAAKLYRPAAEEIDISVWIGAAGIDVDWVERSEQSADWR